jgi:probable phosphoglycerate mutase
VTVVRWARHGQNEANVSQTFSHRVYDADLTELGRRQAQALAERLAAEPVAAAAVVTSPLCRARQTADVVAVRAGLATPVALERLRELDVGALDGRSDPAAWVCYEEVLARWAAGDLAARFPDGEAGDELVRRLRDGLAEAVSLGRGEPVVVVAHGGNLQAALPWLAGVVAPEAGLATGAYAVLDVRDARADQVELLHWPGAGPAPER